MGNSDYAQDGFYANQGLIEEAQASGLTRAQIVEEAMALQPIAGVYGVTRDEWGADHGLAMAWSALKGSRIPLGILVISAGITGDWSDVEACYGGFRTLDIKSWHAALQAHKAEERWAPLDSPTRLAFVAAHNKIKDLQALYG